MLAKGGGWAAHASRLLREDIGQPHIVPRPHVAGRDGREEPPRSQMRVIPQVACRRCWPCWDACRLEQSRRLPRILVRRPRGDVRVDFVLGVEPSLHRRESRGMCPGWVAHRLAHGAPLAVIRHCDRKPAVVAPALVDALQRRCRQKLGCPPWRQIGRRPGPGAGRRRRRRGPASFG